MNPTEEHPTHGKHTHPVTNINDLQYAIQKVLNVVPAEGPTSPSRAASGLETIASGKSLSSEKAQAIHPLVDAIIIALSQRDYRDKLIDLLDSAENTWRSKHSDGKTLPAEMPNKPENAPKELPTKKESIEEGIGSAILTGLIKVMGIKSNPTKVANVLSLALTGKGLNSTQTAVLQPVLQAVVTILSDPTTRSAFNNLVKKGMMAAQKQPAAPGMPTTPPPGAKATPNTIAIAPKTPGAATNVNAPVPPAGTPLKSSYMYESEYNPEDTVTVNMPLLLRIMEFAKEDAKTDMDLHEVTENIIKLSEHGDTLTMEDYGSIVNGVSDSEEQPMKSMNEGEQGASAETIFNAVAHRLHTRYQEQLIAFVTEHGLDEYFEIMDDLSHRHADQYTELGSSDISAMTGEALRQMGIKESAQGVNECAMPQCDSSGQEVHNNYNLTKTTSANGATVTINATASEVSELQKIMKLAGLSGDLIASPAPAVELEPVNYDDIPAVSEPLGVIQSQAVMPSQIEPEFDDGHDMGSVSYTTNANTLKSMLVNKMRNKLSY